MLAAPPCRHPTADAVPGEGHSGGHSQTLSLMQSDYVYPLIGNRLSPDDWIDADARLMGDVARDYVTGVLSGPKPDHLSPEADTRILEAFPVRLAPIR